MVTGFQNVHIPVNLICPVIQHIIFCFPLHIAGEEETGLSKFHQQHNGGVVGVRIGFYGTKNGNIRAAEGHLVAGGGQGYFQPLLVHIV